MAQGTHSAVLARPPGPQGGRTATRSAKTLPSYPYLHELMRRYQVKDLVGVDPEAFLRTLDETMPQPIPGTGGGALPFFSPDGTSLGFFRGGEIVQMQLPGGVPTPIVGLRDMGATRNLGDRDGALQERMMEFMRDSTRVLETLRPQPAQS